MKNHVQGTGSHPHRSYSHSDFTLTNSAMDELTKKLKVALGHAPDSNVDVYRDTPLRYMGYCNEVPVPCTDPTHS